MNSVLPVSPASAGPEALLHVLWDADGAEVPLDALQRHTGLSTAQVHGAVDALVARGCLMERSPAGVRLVTAGLNCWSDLLEHGARRGGWRIGRRVHVYATTASTNDAAWQASAGADADGLVVLANHQTAGRGRLGRTWHAGAGQSLLMSILLPAWPAASASLDRLTLHCGLAAAEALEQSVTRAGRVVDSIDIKWPNDLLCRGRKLAGILVEARRPARGAADAGAVVVGIGVNLTQAPADFPPELGGAAISLYEACGKIFDRARIALYLLEHLHRVLFLEPDGDWLQRWRGRCAMLGRRMTFRSGTSTLTGHVLDVDPAHGLIVRDDAGITHFLSVRTCSVQ